MRSDDTEDGTGRGAHQRSARPGACRLAAGAGGRCSRGGTTGFSGCVPARPMADLGQLRLGLVGFATRAWPRHPRDAVRRPGQSASPRQRRSTNHRQRSVHFTTATGANAKLTNVTYNVAADVVWIATKGPDRGIATVTVDGVAQTARPRMFGPVPLLFRPKAAYLPRVSPHAGRPAATPLFSPAGRARARAALARTPTKLQGRSRRPPDSPVGPSADGPARGSRRAPRPAPGAAPARSRPAR